ncbi:MAG: flagellar basal body P-ring formation chaperone FlgA [Vicinamibacterales bacterium]
MLLGLTALLVADPAQAEEDAVRAAITAAVRARAGAAASVTIDVRVAELTPGVTAVDAAEPQAGARFGRPARFRLVAGGRTVGYAVGVVHVTLPLLRVTRPVEAGAAITAGDLEAAVGEPGALPIEALPTVADIVGNTSTRALQPREVMTTRMVRVAPAVRSGAVVATRIVVGGVEAVGTATALQSGQVGDVIRVVNAESRRQLRGRITGKGSVEVQHES